MKAEIHSIAGKKTGEIELSEKVFGLSMNSDLVSQVVNSILSSRRKNIAHVKTRGEVSGGGKKPWKQKGTGRARHGSTRSPIWVGGGVAHGPRNEKNYERKVSKKMRVKALYTILSAKLRDGEILFIDSLKLKEPKTREAKKVLEGLSSVKGFEKILTKKNNSALIALSSKARETERSFRNMSNTRTIEARNLEPIALLEHKYLVLENPEMSLGQLPKMDKPRTKKTKA